MIKWLKKRKSRSKKNFDLHKRGVAAFFIAVMVILPVIQVFQVWLTYRQRQVHHGHTHGRKHS